MCSKGKETNNRLASPNIRFIRAAFSIVKAIRITHCSCKYSKKIQTQYQLLVLILFKKTFGFQHYRDFIEDIGNRESIQQEVELSAVPHFTTHQKFFLQDKNPVPSLRIWENSEFALIPIVITFNDLNRVIITTRYSFPVPYQRALQRAETSTP